MLARVALLGALLLLAAAWFMVRYARRRRRRVGPFPWLMVVFAVALLAFMMVQTFTAGDPFAW